MELFSNHFSKHTDSLLNTNKMLYTNPKSADLQYPLMFTQKINSSLEQIYNQPIMFAHSVAEYFKNLNDSEIAIFSFSTFPSIFGYLIGEQFCKLACDFLLTLFGLLGHTKLTDFLFSSFFASSHGFNSFFWNEIQKNSSKITSSTSFDSIFNITKNCIYSSLPYLSNYFSLVLSSYCAVSIHFHSTFVDTFFINPLLNESLSDISFTSTKLIKIYHSFLKELKQPSKRPQLEEILNIIMKSHEYIQFNPILLSNSFPYGIPLLINDTDLFILYKILKNSSKIQFSYYGDDIKFSNNFIPILFQVYPNFLNEKFNDFIGFHLFDNCQIIDCQTNQEYILQYYLNHVKDIENILLLYEQFYNQKKFNKLIKNHFNSLYYYIMFPYYQATYQKYTKLRDMIATILGYVKVSPKSAFQLSFIALDTFNFNVSKKMKLMQNKFSLLLNQWMEIEWPKYQNNCNFLNRTKYIFETSLLLNKLDDLRLGKRLKLILKFVSILKEILGGQNINDWKLLFAYSVFVAQPKNLLSSYLAIENFVFSENEIINSWNKAVLDKWGMFTVGILNIIRNDQAFCSKCLDQEYCKKLFV